MYDMPDMGARAVANLACEEPDGAIVWTATPGNVGPDAFVSVRLDGTHLVANTWSGFALWLDPQSGHEIGRSFTK